MNFVFGPVASRRLGYSLGLDIVPEKYCTLNCIYCQVGHTKHLTLKRKSFYPVKKILAELKDLLTREKPPKLDFITFSGSGEPTLNKDLGEIIRGVRKVTDTPICILTNGTLLHKKSVRREAALADVVIPSLDAGSDEVFQKVNRPHNGITQELLVDGILKFKEEFGGELWLEIMLIKGINDNPDELLRMKQIADKIDPARIQLNTVVRPPQESFAEALSPIDLNRIKELFGPKAEPIPGFTKCEAVTDQPDLLNAIVDMVKRRSITAKDLVSTMGVTRPEAQEALDKLVADGRIRKMVHVGKTFYQEKY